MVNLTISTNQTVSINTNGGVYKPGKAYDLNKRLEVAQKYFELQQTADPNVVSSRKLAKAANVGNKFANKVIGMIKEGEIVDPTTTVPNRPRGVGSKVFTATDELVLLALRDAQPTRTLNSYRRELFRYTGTNASESTICRWFLNRFNVKGGLRVSSNVPIDKYSAENLVRTMEYINTVRQFSPYRLKFGDEKSLKGEELFTRLVRRNPLTGIVEDIQTDSDFRNSYNIIGFCGIDRRTAPMDYYVTDGTNDADSFQDAVVRSVSKQFLLPWDVVVLDNASIHRYGAAATLEDWLWNQFRILVVFLPTRTPEYNPIELQWNKLVVGLRNFNLEQPRPFRDAVVHAACQIMDEWTHEDVEKSYRKCGYIP